MNLIEPTCAVSLTTESKRVTYASIEDTAGADVVLVVEGRDVSIATVKHLDNLAVLKECPESTLLTKHVPGEKSVEYVSERRLFANGVDVDLDKTARAMWTKLMAFEVNGNAEVGMAADPIKAARSCLSEVRGSVAKSWTVWIVIKYGNLKRRLFKLRGRCIARLR